MSPVPPCFRARATRALSPVLFLRPGPHPLPARPRLRLLAVACALLAPLPALAGEAEAEALDRVVVTATRTALTTDAALAPVEVIDRPALERSQARSVAELLRGRAGVDIANQGGPGKLTTVFLRGSESDHVLVLIDGVRVGSATSGLAAFQDLPLQAVDRIEIVRGPRSSLYGSDAIGGVIQIFTRRDAGAPSARMTLGAGSHGLREIAVGAGGSGERGWVGVDLGWTRTDGIDACDGIGFPVFAGCFTTEPDRDGYDRLNASVRGGLRLGEAVQLDAQLLQVQAENEYDGSFVNRSEVRQQVLGAQLRWDAGERVDVSVGIGRNRDASDNFLDTPGAGTAANGFFDTRRDSAHAQADIALAEGQLLTVGADWLYDTARSDTDFDATSRRNVAGFAQYQGRLGARHDLQIALRRDDNEQFGGETTGTAAWGFAFADGWRATASYGTAFKAPSFNELYFPFFGNPDLRPERSKTWEAGVAWRTEAVELRVDAFSTEVDDLIAFDAALFLPNNIETARLRGAELGAQASLAGWELAGSASWLDAENRTDGVNRGNALPRRAPRKARLDVDRRFGAFGLGLTAVAQSARYDDIANTRRLPGYATLDLRLDYAFSPDWTLQALIGNALDREYETAAYYNQEGRTYGLRLRYAPGAR